MKKFTKLHFVFTVFMLLLLIPASIYAHIRSDNPTSDIIFMLGWIIQSAAWAAVLYQLGMPGSWQSLFKGWKRFLITLLIPLIILPTFGAGLQGWLLCFVAVVIAEFHFRGARWRAALSALIPWIYLTFSLQIMLAWNADIVSVRHFNLYDTFFQHLDWTLFHISVQHLALSVPGLYLPAEAIYYAMPGAMGAAMLFLCLAGDREAAWDFAGSIAVAYYISLILFFMFPAKGPYTLGPKHLPAYLLTASVQHALESNARTLYHHSAWTASAYGYFISFPSMHIVQPLLAGWYLRRWKRVSGLVFVYCALLVASILILEWHYVVDLVGGILVAIVAAWLAPISLGRVFRSTRPRAIEAESAQPLGN
ncbi:MAG TPA: phosphatase PAP2 family protein [Terracidiphilus sp.]|nr:phosphatase PAP2 family protein [Terracidiphilus sp.]